QRIAQLEMENDQLHHLRQALPDLAQQYQALADSISQVVYMLDERGFVLTVNRAVTAWGDTPEEWIGRLLAARVDESDREHVARVYAQLVDARQDRTHTHQFRLRAKTGELRWLEAQTTIRFSEQGRFHWCQGVCRDLTPMLQPENNMAVAPEAAAAQATPRVLELTRANEALRRTIDERFLTEKALRDREADLEMEKTNLQEANMALKVLLKRREEDKRALEEQVMYNVKKLVLPFLSKVQKESLDERQKSYLGIVEANLRDITCGFSRRLSLAYYGLSTSELKVANFIRQGKKNREIADLLNLSVRTVEAYRQAIRNKLRLQNKKVNLRTFLMSIN
ncbi:MAG: PAS domain S-box protein, partial [Desulfobacterales bacterium]|nr:PAS domain S-box protein [Desulfobacterales bacterium]